MTLLLLNSLLKISAFSSLETLCKGEMGTVILAFLPNSLWDLPVESIWRDSLSS